MTQLELGTPEPMRPSTAVIALTAGAVSLPRDAAPVDWTAAGTKLPVGTAPVRVMDERTNIGVDAANKKVNLKAGIYLIQVMLRVTNTSGDNETFRLALTNASGSTVHKEGLDTVVAGNARWWGRMTTVLHLAVSDSICVRGAQVTDTGGADDIQVAAVADEFLLIQKIGNGGEV